MRRLSVRCSQRSVQVPTSFESDNFVLLFMQVTVVRIGWSRKNNNPLGSFSTTVDEANASFY